MIKPYGFDLSEKSVRRAGLDYWKYVQLKEFESWNDFIERENPLRKELLFFENDGKNSFYQAPYLQKSYLIFGAETKGLPSEIYEAYFDRFYFLPQYSSHIRSLNLSNAATAVAYQALSKLI